MCSEEPITGDQVQEEEAGAEEWVCQWRWCGQEGYHQGIQIQAQR